MRWQKHIALKKQTGKILKIQLIPQLSPPDPHMKKAQ